MLIQQLNRTDAEKIQLIVKNVDGSGSITTGMGAALVVTAASGDGIGAVRNVTGGTTAQNFCGIAVADIPINGFGLVTAWGYAASVFLSQSVGSWTITAGDVLIASGLAGAFTSVVTNVALSQCLYRYVTALGAVADTISNPRPYMAGLVRAL